MYFNFKGFRKPRRYSMDENGWFSCRIQTKFQWSRCWTCSPVHLTMQMLNIKILNQILFYRAHLNDLENILPYLFAGFFYVLTNPAVLTAQLLFKVAAISRIVHTIVYTIVIIPQPARGLAFFIHYVITFYMAVSVLFHDWVR